jgi:hypothetical protein
LGLFHPPGESAASRRSEVDPIGSNPVFPKSIEQPSRRRWSCESGLFGVDQALTKFRSVKTRFLVICILLLLGFPYKLSASGVFEDYFARSLFLTSGFERSVAAGFLRAGKGEQDASGFSLASVYSLKESVLLRAELSYFVLSNAGEINSGFGDFILKGRAHLYNRNPFHLFLTAGLRTGSGTHFVYPYSSGSIDVRGGMGFVDSLAVFTLWGEITGASVSKKPGGLSKAQSYGDFATLSLGMFLPISGKTELNFGGVGYMLRSGGNRDIYFAGVKFGYSEDMEFFASFQAEGGSSEERVNDFALSLGIITEY